MSQRKLILSMQITLDGYVAGPDDAADWLVGDVTTPASSRQPKEYWLFPPLFDALPGESILLPPFLECLLWLVGSLIRHRVATPGRPRRCWYSYAPTPAEYVYSSRRMTSISGQHSGKIAAAGFHGSPSVEC